MTPTLSERVAEAVATARKQHSVKEIAAACDVSLQSVYSWGRGETMNLKGETLVELAEISGLSARWIINGKGKKLGIGADERMILEALPYMDGGVLKLFIEAAKSALKNAAASEKRA